MSRGRCLCGAVVYRVDGALRSVVVCHCVDCRRWHGSAVAMTCADRGDLTVAGEESLRWYAQPDGPVRGFCGRCGSSLFWSVPARPSISIAAGTLDAPSGLRTVAHIWCDQVGDYEDAVTRHPRGAPPDLAAPPRGAW